ncbi:MAG: hypothetical protein ABSH56_08020 [Bryobacteraceae bacterium]
MPPLDLDMFIGSLSALLRFFPAQSTRLVVFNLEQRKELFRSDGFQPAALKDAAEAIQTIQAGTVDYANLQRPASVSEFLAGLIDREIRDGNASDLVVFLGPALQEQVPLVRQTISPDGPHPVFAYLQLTAAAFSSTTQSRISPAPDSNVEQGPGCGVLGRPCPPPPPAFDPRLSRSPAAVRDAISRAVAMLGGETVAVSEPAGLAKALKALADRRQARGAKR